MTMSRLRFHTLDVFTTVRYGGNPLAVVLEADGLNPGQMQRIAREFNLSETVFVLKPTRDDTLAKLRIFTPGKEMPFAGHPTVGTACLLADLGLAPAGDAVNFVFEENVGLVPIHVQRTTGAPTFAQLTAAQAPSYGPEAPPPAVLARLLGIAEKDIVTVGDRPRTASCGVPFLLVPVRAPEVLAGIQLDIALLHNALTAAPLNGWATEVYVYARAYEQDWQARMFAPDLGIFEDPATGSAAAALAGALALEAETQNGRLHWTLAQGMEMGRPSYLDLQAEKQAGTVTAVRVGGHAVPVSEGILYR